MAKLLVVLIGLCIATNVLELNDDTIELAIRQIDSILIEFYAPWCMHCKKLLPKYEEAADILKESGSNTVVARIDATQNKISKEKWEVKGFPTILYYENGEFVEKYHGKRSTLGIVQYVLQQAKG